MPTSIGFSGILFAQSTFVHVFISKKSETFQLGASDMKIPHWFVPILSCFLAYAFVPNSSTVGHISGILSGLLFGILRHYIFGPKQFSIVLLQFCWIFLPPFIFLILFSLCRNRCQKLYLVLKNNYNCMYFNCCKRRVYSHQEAVSHENCA